MAELAGNDSGWKLTTPVMPVLSLLKVQIPSTLSTLSKKWRLLSCGVLHPKIFMSFNDLLNPEEEAYVVDHATDKGIFDAAINIKAAKNVSTSHTPDDDERLKKPLGIIQWILMTSFKCSFQWICWDASHCLKDTHIGTVSSQSLLVVHLNWYYIMILTCSFCYFGWLARKPLHGSLVANLPLFSS